MYRQEKLLEVFKAMDKVSPHALAASRHPRLRPVPLLSDAVYGSRVLNTWVTCWILQKNSGTVEFKELKEHVQKYGNAAISEGERRDIYLDIDTNRDHTVSQPEFLTYFAKAICAATNEEFDRMVKELLS